MQYRIAARAVCASCQCSRRLITVRRMATAAPDPSPSPLPGASIADPKIQRIVDEISGLTLLQAADLVQELKTRLNIQEIALPAAAAGPAAAAPAAEVPVEEKPKEKTIFTVKLEKFDATSKAKVIKEIKAIVPNMNLVEAKKFVESAPQVIRENVPKEEAEKLKKTFTDLGATISLE